MDDIALTVIVPVYNSEEYIETCLQSILGQVFTDYEIIIRDGGSTDNTLNIVEGIKLKYPSSRIKIVSEPDHGVYDAMNKGAEMAAGEWLYFIGSDDHLFDIHVFENVFSIIRKNNIELVYGNVKKIGSGEIYFGKFDFEKLLGYNICHQSIFLKKTIFKKYGPFDLTFPACADWDLNLKLFKNKARIKYSGLLVANYNENGFSNLYRDQLFFDKLKKETSVYYSNMFNKVASLGKRAIKRLRNLNKVTS